MNARAAAEPAEVEVLIEIPRGSFLKRGYSGHVDFVSPLPCPFNYGAVPQYIGLEGDLRSLGEMAHWLKGTGGTVGFDCFTEPAQRLEQLSKSRSCEEISACLDELADLADRLAVSS